MVKVEEERMLEETIKISRRAGFSVYLPELGRRYCFDISIRKGDLLVFIKVAFNIDCIPESLAMELKLISKNLDGSSLIVGHKTRGGPMEDDVIYERYEIPAINLETLKHILIEGRPPIVYAGRGGYYVKINGPLIRALREERKLSLGDIANYVGVSRRAIYEYERGNMAATVETAIRLEELFDVPVAMPLGIFDRNYQVKLKRSRKPKNSLEELFLQRMIEWGMRTFLTNYAPFDALSKSESKGAEEEKMIAGIEKKETRKKIELRGEVLSKLSKMIEATAIFLTKKRGLYLDGVIILTPKELSKMKTKKQLKEMMNR
ncbi:MAG: transcriptional regulator [Candidatus Asgardarchaeia archaeon]